MLRQAASTITALALTTAFGAAPAAATTFKWTSASDIPTWDIHSQNNALSNGVHASVYESLFYYNRKFELEPILATGYKQVTPSQVRITLRKNVKFHDGTPFTADDVVFSFERILKPSSNMKVYAQGIEGGEEDRRLHRRHHHRRPESGPAARTGGREDHEPRLGDEEQLGQSSELCTERRRTSRPATPMAPARSC